MGRRLTDDERENRKEAGKYLPTAEEISAACREIQAEWTDQERMRRSAPERPVDMGIIHHVVGEEEQ